MINLEKQVETTGARPPQYLPRFKHRTNVNNYTVTFSSPNITFLTLSVTHILVLEKHLPCRILILPFPCIPLRHCIAWFQEPWNLQCHQSPLFLMVRLIDLFLQCKNMRWKLVTSVIARFEVLTVAMVRIQFFRDVKLCHWMNDSHPSKKHHEPLTQWHNTTSLNTWNHISHT